MFEHEKKPFITSNPITCFIEWKTYLSLSKPGWLSSIKTCWHTRFTLVIFSHSHWGPFGLQMGHLDDAFALCLTVILQGPQAVCVNMIGVCMSAGTYWDKLSHNMHTSVRASLTNTHRSCQQTVMNWETRNNNTSSVACVSKKIISACVMIMFRFWVIQYASYMTQQPWQQHQRPAWWHTLMNANIHPLLFFSLNITSWASVNTNKSASCLAACASVCIVRVHSHKHTRIKKMCTWRRSCAKTQPLFKELPDIRWAKRWRRRVRLSASPYLKGDITVSTTQWCQI